MYILFNLMSFLQNKENMRYIPKNKNKTLLHMELQLTWKKYRLNHCSHNYMILVNVRYEK